MEISQIKQHFAVQAKEPGNRDGSGIHIGTVDQVEGDQYIKLTQNDASDGQHHWFPIAWVERVENQTVYLNKTPAEVKAGLLDRPNQSENQSSPTVDVVSGAGVD